MSEHLRRQWREAPGPSQEYLDQVAELMKTSPTKGRAYSGPDEVVRSLGKQWRNISPTLPRNVKRGPLGNCYGNALNAAMADRSLIYVEGYAYSKFFPMKHAWVVDGNGTVYDPTWPEPGTDYFGIPFETTWVARYTSNSGYTSVLGTDFIHDGLLEILAKGLPDSALNTTGVLDE